MTRSLISLAGALSLTLMTSAQAAQGSGCMPTTGTVSDRRQAPRQDDARTAMAKLTPQPAQHLSHRRNERDNLKKNEMKSKAARVFGAP